jgi:transposase
VKKVRPKEVIPRGPQNTQREREIFLYLLNLRDPKTNKRLLTSKMICQIPHAPSRSTLNRWQKEAACPPRKKARKGRPPLLSEVEKLVLGGWVLDRVNKHKVTGISQVKAFVQESFGVKVSSTWVSRKMHALGFSFQKTQESNSRREFSKEQKIITSFLRRTRRTIEKMNDLSRVIAMDVMGFWNTGVVRHSYALRSGYIHFGL